jgi:hypothetical protein
MISQFIGRHLPETLAESRLRWMLSYQLWLKALAGDVGAVERRNRGTAEQSERAL